MSSGARYGVTHETAAGTDKALINLTGSASVRCYLYDLVIGSDAAPADAGIQCNVNRSTGVGTGGSALTEQKLDPLTVNAATGAAVGGTYTTDPADGNELLAIAFNQRATFRWVAAPQGEIVTTASANNGLMIRSVSSSTGTPNLVTSIYWRE
jgi:hypothetical protein